VAGLETAQVVALRHPRASEFVAPIGIKAPVGRCCMYAHELRGITPCPPSSYFLLLLRKLVANLVGIRSERPSSSQVGDTRSTHSLIRCRACANAQPRRRCHGPAARADCGRSGASSLRTTGMRLAPSEPCASRRAGNSPGLAAGSPCRHRALRRVIDVRSPAPLTVESPGGPPGSRRP